MEEDAEEGYSVILFLSFSLFFLIKSFLFSRQFPFSLLRFSRAPFIGVLSR